MASLNPGAASPSGSGDKELVPALLDALEDLLPEAKMQQVLGVQRKM